MIPPLAIPITIVIGGTPVQSYNHAYLMRGRIMAPAVPFVTRCADRVSYHGKIMVIRRGDRTARILTGVVEPRTLQAYYVPVSPAFRSLGAQIRYDRKLKTLFVRCLAPAPLRTMQPNEQQPHVAPTTVFTPEPVATPRPVYTGSPHPRRTPIIVTTPRP
ncbi:MAG: hypothetical protein JOZ97_06750 [Candidatus Eremiobacteraeota bacterium]|nr:hypothetical protein [Candidatus Eremiobacteraeota bacterium]